MPGECLSSIYFAFIRAQLVTSICIICLTLQKIAIRQIAFANHHDHCAPVAKQLCSLFLNDIYKLSVCCFMFKVFNNVYPSSLPSLFTKFAAVHLHCSKASNYNFQLHACKSDYVKYPITIKVL